MSNFPNRIIFLLLFLLLGQLGLGYAQTIRKEAYVDIGSGNTKLVIVTYPGANQPVQIETKRTAILFKKNLTNDKKFPVDIEKLGLATLKSYAQYATQQGAILKGGGATSGLRAAEPVYASALLTEWAKATGWKLKILTPEEESHAGYYAMTMLLPALKGSDFIGFDMGGGSTQLMREQDGKVIVCTLEIGAVTFSQFFQKKYGDKRPALAEAMTAVKQQFFSNVALQEWTATTTNEALCDADRCCGHKQKGCDRSLVAIGGVVFGFSKLIKLQDGRLGERKLVQLEGELRNLTTAQVEEKYPSTKPYGAEMWSNTVALLTWMDLLGIREWRILEIEMGAGLGGLPYFK